MVGVGIGIKKLHEDQKTKTRINKYSNKDQK